MPVVTRSEAIAELGTPGEVQRKLLESFLKADEVAVRTSIANLHKVCRMTNARWRVRAAAKKALKQVGGQLTHGHEEARREACRVVACVEVVLGRNRASELLESLELQHAALSV